MNTTQTATVSHFIARLGNVDATTTDREGRVIVVDLTIAGQPVGQARWAMTSHNRLRFDGGHTTYRGSVYSWKTIKDMEFGAAMAAAEAGRL